MINRKATMAVMACALLAGPVLLAGCGSAKSGPSITLYNGQHEQTTNGLVTAFEKQTGITVNVRNDRRVQFPDITAIRVAEPANKP